MPYKDASDAPSHVPKAKRKQWVEVFNSTYSSCTKAGRKEKFCEQKAFKTANGVVKKREVEMDLFEKLLHDIQKVIDGFKTRALSIPQMYELTMSALREAEVEGWLADIYKDDDGSVFAVTTMRGKLYKTPLTFSGSSVEVGETQEVLINFEPQSRGFTIQRSADNDEVRWISRSCTSIINKEGEIDSRMLFDSFVDHIRRTGEYPYRTFWHKGEQFKTGVCDFVARDGNILVTSGVYDKTELAEMEIQAREADPDYWGDSIQYDPTSEPEMLDVGDGITIPVYTSGIFREVSTLPDNYASAFYTNNSTLKEVKRAMEAKQFEAFVKLFNGDEDKAKTWLEDNVDPVNREIEEENVISRDADDVEAEIEPVVAEEEVTEEPEEDEDLEVEAEVEEVDEEDLEDDEDADEEEFLLDEAAVEAIAGVTARHIMGDFEKKFTEIKDTISDVQTSVAELQAANIRSTKTLEERVANLEQSAEETLEGMLNDLPRNTVSRRVSYRPSQQEASDDEGDESLEDVANATLANIK